MNPCTDDICATGFCEYALNSIVCDDGNACTSVDICVSGECLGVASLNCNDNNECTLDACDPQSGCHNEPQTGMACNDGNACTTTDICEKDVCAGEATVCDDQNPCTDDSCDEQSGCVFTLNNSNPCEDGSLCTTDDFCDAGKCQGGQTLKCNDGNICTDDVCQPTQGCVYLANQVGCDDGNGCTIGDICADSACVSGTNICECATDEDCAVAEDNNLCNGTLVCDTSKMPFQCVVNPDTIITCPTASDTVCFKNICQPTSSGKCEMEAVNEGGGCDDGNACATGDACSKGVCAGASIKCDDSNVCTDDSCDPTSGCVYTPNNAECADDGNECTTDICQSGKCAHPPTTDGADCDDGTVCTIVDICQSGQCIGMAPLDCDDNDQCTLDICHKALGCQHSKMALNGQICDNGDACTTGDTCQDGACQAGTQTCECYITTDCVGMEDGNFCNGTLVCNTVVIPHQCVVNPNTIITCPTASDTTCSKNTCQLASGKCEMKAMNEGVACDDGNPCTETDICQNGQCNGTPKPTGTVIFQDDFNDGNIDGWTVKTWNSCPNCSMCPCDLPTIVVTDETPFWVKMSPLAGSGHVLFTTPATLLPKGGTINFLFAGVNCAGTGSNCEVRTSNGTFLGNVTSYNYCATQPPSCPTKFNIIEDEKNSQVVLDCTGVSNGSYNACGATYLDDFSITCP